MTPNYSQPNENKRQRKNSKYDLKHSYSFSELEYKNRDVTTTTPGFMNGALLPQGAWSSISVAHPQQAHVTYPNNAYFSQNHSEKIGDSLDSISYSIPTFPMSYSHHRDDPTSHAYTNNMGRLTTDHNPATKPVFVNETNLHPPRDSHILSAPNNPNNSHQTLPFQHSHTPKDPITPSILPRLQIQALLNSPKGAAQSTFPTVPAVQNVVSQDPNFKGNNLSEPEKEGPPAVTRVETQVNPENSKKEQNISPEARKIFEKLIPQLDIVNVNSICALLATVLKEYRHHISIDLLYNFLFDEKAQGLESILNIPAPYIDKTVPSTHALRGLEVCHLILDTFKSTDSTASNSENSSIQGLEIPPLNFYELIRNLLAMKILASCMEKTQHPGSSSISRSSVYKLYYILCQKLMKRYATQPYSYTKRLIVGQSRLGRLMRIVDPDMVSKRLGRRGNSKYHYVGVTWNNSVVDEGILSLLDLEISQIETHFEGSPQTSEKQCEGFDSKQITSQIWASQKDKCEPEFQQSSSACTIPTNQSTTFVTLSHHFPSFDCSPRIWKRSPNLKLKHSQWAKESIERSLKVVNAYPIPFGNLLQSFNDHGFSEKSLDSLQNAFVQTLNVLLCVSAAKEVFAHLYSMVLLSVVPLIIASDEELPKPFKGILCESIIITLTMIDAEPYIVEHSEQISLGSFTRALRMLTSLSASTSCKIKSLYIKGVLKEMVRDIDHASKFIADATSDMSDLDSVSVEAIIKATYAYNFKLTEDASKSQSYDFGQAVSVSDAAKVLKNLVIMSNEAVTKISDYAKNQDLPYQIFKIVAELFHEFTLTDSFLRKLPIPVITSAMNHIITWVHYNNFHNFGKVDPELSKETFRCWLAFCNMLRDYICIISEVVALSEILS